MQLSGSFTFLLTALLFGLTQVEASPTQRSPGFVTLPLKRLPLDANAHPTVLLQQQINRGTRRHARMTGREAELEKRLNLARPPKSTDKRGANPKNGFPESSVGASDSNDLTPAKTPTAKNSLGLGIEGNDVGYVAVVQVGTPPRNFNILMDSGSADFWIGGENCQSQDGGDCGNHNFLGPRSSSTFKDTGKKFQITYGTGEVSGDIVNDNIILAGLSLKNHPLGVANIESTDFSGDDTKFDGLLGLAKSSISNQGVPTPVEALASAGLISQAITSYKISRFSDGLNDGEITFGGLDSSKYDPSTLVTFQNVNTQGFWEGAIGAITVGGKSIGLTGRTGILDTGTTLIIAPSADVKAVHAKIPGAKSQGKNGYTIPCTNTVVVSLTFGGRAFDINPIDLIFAPVDENDLTGACYSGISPGTIGGAKEWLVGDVFLKNAYYSTNVNKNTISLAKLV